MRLRYSWKSTFPRGPSSGSLQAHLAQTSRDRILVITLRVHRGTKMRKWKLNCQFGKCGRVFVVWLCLLEKSGSIINSAMNAFWVVHFSSTLSPEVFNVIRATLSECTSVSESNSVSQNKPHKHIPTNLNQF